MDLLDEGINVISAVNIQHIESVNEEVQGISGIEVKERIPDSVLQEADEVVNIDLTAEELITRLKAGKIYKPEKVPMALNNFFKTENPSGGKQLCHGQPDHRHQQYRAPQPCGRKTFQGEGRAQGDKELKHACSHSGGVFRQCAGKRR